MGQKIPHFSKSEYGGMGVWGSAFAGQTSGIVCIHLLGEKIGIMFKHI